MASSEAGTAVGPNRNHKAMGKKRNNNNKNKNKKTLVWRRKVQPGEVRNWTDLPDDITASILSRVGAIDVLKNAQKVCMKWQRISKDPLMWRTIDMRNDFDDLSYQLEAMCRHAVDRSRGGLVDINIEYFGTDELLEYITHRSKGIKRLRLVSCEEISEWGLIKVAPKLPMLEDLEISLCPLWPKSIAVVGRACPRLKSFKLNRDWSEEMGYECDYYSDDDDGPFAGHEFSPVYFDTDGEPFFPSKPNQPENSDALAVAKTMHNLCHLQLFGNKIEDLGLGKILDSCPLLESLDLRHCLNLKLEGSLGIRCAKQIKNLWLPRDSTKGCDIAGRCAGVCLRWTELSDNITASILSRLGAIDILENAQKVCMKWRRICKDPLMWPTVDMENDGCYMFWPYDLDKMCRHAVDRSCGNLEDINIPSFGHEDLLEYITNSSNKIRRLRLAFRCGSISTEGLIGAASKLPLLEDLEIVLCEFDREDLEAVGRSCPLLRSFKLNTEWYNDSANYPSDSDEDLRDENAIAIGGTMPGLLQLQIVGNQLTNVGLKKILDGCPHLESLDLRCCFNLDLSGDLERICRERIKKLLLPNDSIADYPRHHQNSHDNDDYDDSIARNLYDPRYDDGYDDFKDYGYSGGFEDYENRL